MKEKKRFVTELADGEQLVDLFLVKNARLSETRAGKPYLSLVLADKTGEISGPAWDNAKQLEPLCAVGSVVRVFGQVQTFRDSLQVRIEDIQAVDETHVDMSDFVQASVRSGESMHRELVLLINGVKDQFLRQLLKKIFLEGRQGELFQTAPAAKGIHHAYLGGLVEHSLSMAQVAALLAGHYPLVDRDLLVSGALLHDIGKTEELFSEAGVIEYTDIGRLKGHLVIGCELVGRIAKTIPDFPLERLTHLQHLILSHHGRHEFGSPVVPMTAEALLLSFIDDMDAKMNLVEQLSRKLKTGVPSWSDYQRSLERYLLIKPFPCDGDDQEYPGEKKGEGRQQSLF